MNFLKKLFAKYTAFLWALLAPLGVWGVFAIAAIDASFFGIPMDPVIAFYVYAHPSNFWICCLLASVGSTLGSMVPYAIGRAGGELLLEKKIKKERLEALRDRFARQEFFAVMVPAMLPPPTPFKMFVLAAGVFEMKAYFAMLAIATGRFLRFLILSLLTIHFGPQVVQGVAHIAGKRLAIALLVAIAAATLYIVLRKRSRRAQSLSTGSVGTDDNSPTLPMAENSSKK